MSGPANSTVDEDGRRVYLWPPTGERFDSVTTIIKGGTPTSEGLVRWIVGHAVSNYAEWVDYAAKGQFRAALDVALHGAAERREEDIERAKAEAQRVTLDALAAADRTRDAAADRGTAIHGAAEALAMGDTPEDVSEAVAPYVRQFRRFLDRFRPEYVYTEATVYSRTHGYAGTLDWMAYVPGIGLVLGDTKTKEDGKRLYGDAIGLQLAAYRYAEFLAVGHAEAPIPGVDACLALVLRPSSYDLIPVEADRDAFAAFLAARRVKEWAERGSRRVLGKNLAT